MISSDCGTRKFVYMCMYVNEKLKAGFQVGNRA